VGVVNRDTVWGYRTLGLLLLAFAAGLGYLVLRASASGEEEARFYSVLVLVLPALLLWGVAYTFFPEATVDWAGPPVRPTRLALRYTILALVVGVVIRWWIA
jgi:hypothetical protein